MMDEPVASSRNFNLRLDNIEILYSILLYCAYTFNFVDVILSASVQNRELRTVYLNQAVVYAQRIKSAAIPCSMVLTLTPFLESTVPRVVSVTLSATASMIG